MQQPNQIISAYLTHFRTLNYTIDDLKNEIILINEVVDTQIKAAIYEADLNILEQDWDKVKYETDKVKVLCEYPLIEFYYHRLYAGECHQQIMFIFTLLVGQLFRLTNHGVEFKFESYRYLLFAVCKYFHYETTEIRLSLDTDPIQLIALYLNNLPQNP